MAKEVHKGIPAVSPRNRKAWRQWLAKNHTGLKNVWLVFYNKKSGKARFGYDEAVEEALCFGWIDGTANPRDEESSYRLFAQRNPKSNWSKLNRERAERLINEGLMAEAGLKMIELAKKSGTWEALIDVQNSVIPPDLQKLLDKNKTALKNFSAFPPSSKRIILEWILNAKRPETREKRLKETVELAAQNIKANHYRQ
ncbi:MAG: YdeI/OmpD-associated family protein [Chitinophagales bacterium]